MANVSPHFTKPPLIEVVVGLQFEPLQPLRNAHLALFWSSLGRAKWPVVADLPPLEQQFETFEDKPWAAGFRFQLTQNPASRFRVFNAANDRFLQLQNGRIHLNWVAQSAEGKYPRYSALRGEFVDLLGQFETFLAEQKLGRLSYNQWELTYVNHFEHGELWRQPADVAGIIPGLLAAGDKKLPLPLEVLACRWVFQLPPQRGRLHVELEPTTSKNSGSNSLSLKLTARGPVSDGGDPRSGLDLGHDAIVSTFLSITSESARRAWGQQQ